MTYRTEWTDISNGELRAKIEQRGWTSDVARQAAQYRDRPDWAAWIEQVLKP